MTSGATKTPALSSSVGDYLKAIWSLGGAASTKDVSGQLSVSPASVTSMLGRFQEMGLVRYERYRGASLTGLGRSEAFRLGRRPPPTQAFFLVDPGVDCAEGP